MDFTQKFEREEYSRVISQVDPFLIEALENPRHRLAVLRMEFEIQQFIQDSNQCQFEFQPFPTSYLRRAAHRVAQHYGLQTMSVDNITDGFGSRIVVRKTPESKFPPICLSDIPIKQHENEKSGQVKIVVRRRPSNASLCSTLDSGNSSLMRTVEERMEDYDKARARIFNPSSFSIDEKAKVATSRIAIFRDREKDRSDPDYNRSYDRYVSGFAPCRNFAAGVSNVRRLSPMAQLAFRPPQVLPPLCNFGAVYLQWPTPAMLYSHSHEHLRNAVFQAPVYQQP